MVLTQKNLVKRTTESTETEAVSDLLVSELLILGLSLPALLRPFSRQSRKISAIPLLPVLALSVGALTVLGQGLTLDLTLSLVSSSVVCLTELPRLVAFSQGIPNDLYSAGARIARVLLLVAGVFTLVIVCLCAPEPGYRPSRSVVRSSFSLRLGNTKVNAGLLLSLANPYETSHLDNPSAPHPSENPQSRAHPKQNPVGVNVVVLKNTPQSAHRAHPETLELMLAERGYTVFVPYQDAYSPSYSAASLAAPMRTSPGVVLLSSALRGVPFDVPTPYVSRRANTIDAATFEDAHVPALFPALFALCRHAPTFVYAESAHEVMLSRFLQQQPHACAGVFFVLPDSAARGPHHAPAVQGAPPPVDTAGVASAVRGASRTLPAVYRQYVHAAEAAWAELASTDILAAYLAGLPRDSHRTRLQARATQVDQWIRAQLHLSEPVLPHAQALSHHTVHAGGTYDRT